MFDLIPFMISEYICMSYIEALIIKEKFVNRINNLLGKVLHKSLCYLNLYYFTENFNVMVPNYI